jgi:adenosylcobinamide-GDP ribazoletransferase
MKKEFDRFRTALMFFTRIPVGKIDFSQEHLNKSNRYLPIIGWIVGGVSGLSFWGLNLVLPIEVSVILSMSISILLTGAFHEDGFADTCDGLGGGWSKKQILEIMKDSRIGVFGAIGVAMLILTKFISISHMPAWMIPMVLIAAHTISRFSVLLFIFTHNYTRDDHTGKSKPIGKKISLPELGFASFTALLPFFLFKQLGFALLIPVILLIKYIFARYTNKWIGGYTGDLLGALQQITETSFYVLVILYIYIQN